MPDLIFAVPGGLDLPTGGAVYDRKLAEALRGVGWRVHVLDWPASFPFPSEAERQEVAADLARLPDGALVLIDGLALGTLPALARQESGRLRLAALVHHPLARETGLPPEDSARFEVEEREALRWVGAVIVTSDATGERLSAEFGVPRSRIRIALPGIERRPRHRGERKPGPTRILTLGQVTPRKAHHVLVEALARLTELDWACTIAGDLERDPGTTAALRAQIAAAGLADRVTLTGVVSDEESARLHADAELFAFPSLYEGYGMALADAMAWGLPIVATTGGAIQEVVPPTAGLLVPPGGVGAFADALRMLLSDADRRAALAEGAKAAAAKSRGWDATAEAVAAALEGVGAPAKAGGRGGSHGIA